MYVKCDITGFGIFEVVAVATERQALCSELFKTVVWPNDDVLHTIKAYHALDLVLTQSSWYLKV